MHARLIVFEGADAVGKSTLAADCHSLIIGFNPSAELLSFPGQRSGSLGKLVYELHHNPKRLGVEGISPLALQTLHIAAHLDTITSIILPSIASERWVVLDRFWWSTWVYGRAAGIDPQTLDTLIQAEKLTLGGLKPSVVFLVERSVPLGSASPDPDFANVTALYQEISAMEVAQHEVVHLLDQEFEEARNSIAEWLKRRREQ
jgi:dTMP kinase